ncbi:MAG: zinc metallopeptidase [Pseudomonadota bacterium]
MHPAVILIPAAALILGPRLWVGYVLKQHNQKDEDLPGTAAELARQWLDQNQLQHVPVEITDVGDHYDPEDRAVRLTRDKFNRKSLTAVTTAAHEVSHALQDAVDYPPFVWRYRLAKLAMITGQIGTLVLLTVPAAALFTQRSLPPALIGSTLFAILGSGMATQLAALSSELDASFNRALPLLQDGDINGQQIRDAKRILVACSLTYVAASLLSVIHIWPWIGPARVFSTPLVSSLAYQGGQGVLTVANPPRNRKQPAVGRGYGQRKSHQTGSADKVVRMMAKPVIRTWYRLSWGVSKLAEGRK